MASLLKPSMASDLEYSAYIVSTTCMEIFRALATLSHCSSNFLVNKEDIQMDWIHEYKYKRRCMSEEGCLFLGLVSSEVIILIGWLIAPLRNVSMVWEGWNGWDMEI